MKTAKNVSPEGYELPIEFTAYLDTKKGWESPLAQALDYDDVVYLGHCETSGDMFVTYDHGHICIYKGHLNSGKY